MTTTTNKGITHGWNSGDAGWGADMNENLRRLDAYGVQSWAYDPETSSGLSFAYFGGPIVSSTGVVTLGSAGSTTLADATVNYVERTHAGVVSDNTAGFTDGSLPMYKVTTAGGAMTVIEDFRVPATQVPTGLSPTGAAGGSLGGSYPNPTIATDVSLPGNPTTTTQLVSDDSTRIATTAFVHDAVDAAGGVVDYDDLADVDMTGLASGDLARFDGSNWVPIQSNDIKIDDLGTPDDNTDLNVSTSAHGLAPKLPNDATKYLDGTGAYSVPAGGGGGGSGALVHLGTYTASAQATLDITTRNASGQSGAIFQTDYKHYVITVDRMQPASAAVELYLRVSNDGGSSFPVSGYFFTQFSLSGAGGIASGQTGAGQHPLTYAGVTSNASAGWGVCGRLDLMIGSTSDYPRWFGNMTYERNADGLMACVTQSGLWATTNPRINAVRLLFSSGNIAAGSVHVYGVTT